MISETAEGSAPIIRASSALLTRTSLLSGGRAEKSLAQSCTAFRRDRPVLLPLPCLTVGVLFARVQVAHGERGKLPDPDAGSPCKPSCVLPGMMPELTFPQGRDANYRKELSDSYYRFAYQSARTCSRICWPFEGAPYQSARTCRTKVLVDKLGLSTSDGGHAPLHRRRTVTQREPAPVQLDPRPTILAAYEG